MDNLTQILIGLTMALLTVLVPLAVAIVMDIYQRRREPEEDFAKLDLRVVLENIFQIRLLLLWIILVFISLFAWEIFLCNTSRFVVITFSIIGIGGIGYIIYKIYRWIKGDVFKFRFKYLERLKNSKRYDDLKICWQFVWQTQNIDSENEIKFFNIFSDTIDKLLFKPHKLIKELRQIKPINKNFETILILLNSFKKRIYLIWIWRLTNHIFPKILEWHFKIWGEMEKEIEEREKLTGKRSRIADKKEEVLEILDSILKIIEKRIKVKRNFFSDYINKIRDHIIEIRKKSGAKKYIDYFPAFNNFFEKFKDKEKTKIKTEEVSNEIEKIQNDIKEGNIKEVFWPISLLVKKYSSLSKSQQERLNKHFEK